MVWLSCAEPIVAPDAGFLRSALCSSRSMQGSAQRGPRRPSSFTPPSGLLMEPLVFGVGRRHRISSDSVVAFRIPAIS
ncbi:hypothetical protein U1Q18_025836 [Sarracenia purpurea var. burkii]